MLLKQKLHGGRLNYEPLKFQTAMFLSGYQKAAIGHALERGNNYFRDVKLEAFRSEIGFDGFEADFRRSERFLKGEAIVSKNWNAIEHYVLRSLESAALTQKEKAPQQTRLEGGLIPSSTVKQPTGIDPERTKAKEDGLEETSMVPIFVGIGALLAVLVLSR